MPLPAIKLECLPNRMGQIFTRMFSNNLSEIYQNFLCKAISYQLYYNNKGAYQDANPL